MSQNPFEQQSDFGLDFLTQQNIYKENFDVSTLTEDVREKLKKHTLTNEFPVAVAIILHIFTLGLFTLIYYGLKHDNFPKIKHDDFGSGKAIGFRFIPFFNWYWIFVFWIRLQAKINLQFRLRSQSNPVPEALTVITLALRFFPYINLIAWWIMYPVLIGFVQSALNKLAQEQLYLLNNQHSK